MGVLCAEESEEEEMSFGLFDDDSSAAPLKGTSYYNGLSCLCL